jgi:cyclopropane fatty-acyl-phospholipid synthase-like methyltransferase
MEPIDMNRSAPKPSSRFPYFDALLRLLHDRQSVPYQAFGRHVHWGYWTDPSRADGTAEDFAGAAEALAIELGRAAGLAADQRAIDIGCGLGGTVATLAAQYQGSQWVGLNLDHRQLVYAREEYPTTGQSPPHWIQGDACRLPVAAGVFDAALAVECIFHFSRRRDFFREVRRILKPGGMLAMSDFVPTATLRPILSLLALRPNRLGFYGRCDFSYTLASYRKLAEETGFRTVVERDITRHTLPTYDFLRSLRDHLTTGQASAALETLFAEVASRIGALRYLILAFQRTD